MILRSNFFKKSTIEFIGILTILSLFIISCNQEKIDFNTHVRAILNENCISCHGGVKQSGGFGLVFREYALGETKSGKFGIVPGNPGKSEMIARINHSNPELRMPLDRDPLTEEEVNILTKWVEQGAEWENHWAYIQPEISEIPVTKSDWGTNELDKFILKKLEANGLAPSEEANKFDLIRRVYLDLTGLPPSMEQVTEFIENRSVETYEELVDKLLESPKYGEHWASMWLDLARYADSQGYAQDGPRQIWLYRDWLINALNNDLPFDEFTVEQLAGDLIPDASIEQLKATGFHRNTLNNHEGGTFNEEYRISEVIDRVNTTWEVWQSTTMGCVQCHSHPYDPIRHTEYYSSFAFFNNTADWDVPTDAPLLKELKAEDEIKLKEIKEWIVNRSTTKASNRWEKFLLIGEPKIRPEDFDEVENVVHFNRAGQDYMYIHDSSYICIKDVNLESVDRIYLYYNQGKRYNAELVVTSDSLKDEVLGRVSLSGTKGFEYLPIKLNTKLKKADLYFFFTGQTGDYICEIDGFLLSEELPGKGNNDYEKIYGQIDSLLNASPKSTTPVMIEKPSNHSRHTNIFLRGNWLTKGEEMTAGIPKLLNFQDQELNNRMDMAKWLVSEENPLTGRVIVNRFWAAIFGRGIVETVEDFGTLGAYPSHPELLDWMAIKFTGEWNWSIKKLLKTIVMSATYNQSSITSEEAQEKDPDNLLLSRSPRVRLTAEQIRDQALAVSGLLSDKMYGPSVMPYQPDGIWKAAFSGGNDKWRQSEGEDAFRRGLYTYTRRTSPYPSFMTFDAGGREVCLSRRINTNTPLQALVTMNDPVYTEAARNLAEQIFQFQGDKAAKIEYAYRKVMGKFPQPKKSSALMRLLSESEEYYKQNEKEAYALSKSDNIEMASLTVLANALMNMDEFIVKN